MYKDLSVAITTYNSSKYLDQAIKSVINIKNVNEITISDDASTEKEIVNIKKIIRKYENKLNINLFENKFNIGSFNNKYKAIEKCNNELVYLLDSDNLAGKNLEKTLETQILNSFDKNSLYQPSQIFQFWKFPHLESYLAKFDRKYNVRFVEGSKFLNFEDVRQLLIINSGTYDLQDYVNPILVKSINQNYKNIVLDKWVFWILNCGNFICDKNSMLHIAEEGLSYDRNIKSVDAILYTYLWLKSGRLLYLPNNFYHHHRKRSDSLAFTEKSDQIIGIKYFLSKFFE